MTRFFMCTSIRRFLISCIRLVHLCLVYTPSTTEHTQYRGARDSSALQRGSAHKQPAGSRRGEISLPCNFPIVLPTCRHRKPHKLETAIQQTDTLVDTVSAGVCRCLPTCVIKLHTYPLAISEVRFATEEHRTNTTWRLDTFANRRLERFSLCLLLLLVVRQLFLLPRRCYMAAQAHEQGKRRVSQRVHSILHIILYSYSVHKWRKLSCVENVQYTVCARTWNFRESPVDGSAFAQRPARTAKL